MKSRELINLGYPKGDVLKAAQIACGKAARQSNLSKKDMRVKLQRIIESPESMIGEAHFGPVAEALIEANKEPTFDAFVERDEPAPWKQWGRDLDANSIEQMQNAARLPVAVAGALMPDAHLGYGLPIGGVLATENSVIPFAVGVDIACRMKMTVLDLPTHAIDGQKARLINAIERETRFGIGANFQDPRHHAVMDADFSISDITKRFKDKAWQQLGTSGSGNHFVEFGIFTLQQADLGLDAGTYVALLSHSGSRGIGAQVASYYSQLAMEQHPELPKTLKHLAWLDLDSQEGQEYWLAMNLMGDYAAANHAVIHRELAQNLGADVLLDIENHHNFAWKEQHVINGEQREVIVHRKGATPAGDGVIGIIPGSMATPGYVVRGKGSDASLHSASHGAGRIMSRRAARNSFTWSDARKFLKERGVTVISAGLDEVPFVYKDIETVMSHQEDLVDVIGRFDPKIVKMAPDGERAED